LLCSFVLVLQLSQAHNNEEFGSLSSRFSSSNVINPKDTTRSSAPHRHATKGILSHTFSLSRSLALTLTLTTRCPLSTRASSTQLALSARSLHGPCERPAFLVQRQQLHPYYPTGVYATWDPLSPLAAQHCRLLVLREALDPLSPLASQYRRLLVLREAANVMSNQH
jgi:hypothetical protein